MHANPQIIGFAVLGRIPDGPAARQKFGRIVGRSAPSTHLRSDNYPLFAFHRWKANLRILEIAEIKTIPYVPLSHPFIERLV